jgi:hypothetical protein
MSWSNNRSGRFRAQARRGGGTLLVAISTIAALSVIGGTLALSLTSRSQISGRSASWHEAGVAAESGVDMAVGEIRRVMPGTTPSSILNPWAGWTTSPVTNALPAVGQLPADVLTFVAPSLVHGGEGSTITSAVVTVEAPSLLAFPVGSSNRWLRVRAVGTAPLTGRRQAPLSKLDTALRHLALTRERADIVGRGSRAVSAPEVSRAIEVIVRPVHPFEQAMVSAGALTGTDSASIIDSFDSTDTTKSTLGMYDSNKQQQHGSAFTLGTVLGFAGKIMGDAGTNGGALTKTASISGIVNNSFYQAPVSIATPAWASTAADVTKSVSATVNLSAGLSSSAPARYRLNGTSGKVNISGLSTQKTYLELYVTGDLSGKLFIEPGVQVAIYAAGKIQYAAGDIDNGNNRAASLQIYGIQPAAGVTPNIDLTLGKDLYASIYAPGHALKISANGHLIGSMLAKSIEIAGTMQFHYDESLATQAGPVIDYKVASWIEDVR